MQDISGHSTEFTVSYDGASETLSLNMLDSRNLGLALLALSDLFDRANLLLNGEGVSVELDVRATPPGSFEIELFLAQTYVSTAPFLASGMLTSAANLITIIAGGNGLINLIKRLKGNRPDSIIRDEANDTATLEFEETITETDTETITEKRLTLSGLETLRLFEDDHIARNLADFASTLSGDDIQRVTFRQGTDDLESIDHEEAHYFRVHSGDAEIDELLIPRQKLVVISPYLGSGQNKWRLNDSVNTNWYSMNDTSFRERIQTGSVQFGAETILICDVKVITLISNEKIHREYEILKVWEHKLPGYQPPLI